MNRTTHIYAHRGLTFAAADNTRAAFDKALNLPVDGMETDVQLTRDEVPVLWHDRYMDKLGLYGKTIDEFDFAELQDLDFSMGKSEPEGVLSLKEFLERYRGRCRLQIEIKNRDWEPVERHHSKIKQSLDLIGDPIEHGLFISSFNLDSLAFAESYAPGFPSYYALRDHHTIRDVAQFLDSHPFLAGLCLPIGIINAGIVKLLQDHGKRLGTYTCNTDEEINKALALGVNELISDNPAKALAMRG